MKTSKLVDLAFIAFCLLIVLPLVELGYSHIISQYAIIFMLASYFIGKYVRGYERRKSN
jgi:hypothetical protein